MYELFELLNFSFATIYIYLFLANFLTSPVKDLNTYIKVKDLWSMIGQSYEKITEKFL